MLRLRPYKPCDAKTIVSWCRDEETFRKWTADRYDSFPITAEDMNKKYVTCNGDCADPENFYPMTAIDESGPVGHLTLRFVDEKKTTLRFGFVIVDDTKRGMGYGQEMLRLALRYAFDMLKVERVTLGVFENNLPACRCYQAAGFRTVEMDSERWCEICGEMCRIIEMEIEKK